MAKVHGGFLLAKTLNELSVRCFSLNGGHMTQSMMLVRTSAYNRSHPSRAERIRTPTPTGG
jgi:hypothetical protein